MRGTVLTFDLQRGEGQISGDDGARYRFAGSEWQGARKPAPRQSVDFVTAGDAAVGVVPIAPANPILGDRSRVTAALLAIFLGMIGAHKFYLGYATTGAVILGVALAGLLLAGIPTAILWLVALIEAAIYLAISEATFDARYVHGRHAWF